MGGRKETHGVDDKVIYEPRGGDGEESNPVTFDDQQVGDLGIPHRIAFKPLRFVHIDSPNQNGESWDDTETEGETPDGPEVVRTEAMTKG